MSDKSFFSKFSIKEEVESVKQAVEKLKGMEMGNEKLECYKATKALLIQSSHSGLRAFLLRSLVFLILFVVFLLVISYVENTAVEIACFVVLGVSLIWGISPMFPSPFQVYQQELKKMMKADGIRYRDCSKIES